MNSNHHEDEIFQEKRKPKNPIKFKVELNQEQKEAKSKILENTVTLLAGSAGSGKTLLACQIALEKLFMKEVEKIIITRPTVSKEEIGFLPGDLREKMDPWVQPIYQNMYALYDRIKIEKHIQEGDIEIVPVSFMRGRTFLDSIVIVDEAQNVTHEQMEMIVKVAIALPLGVKRNSGSLAKFPAIAIAVMLYAFHWILVWRLCLVVFLFCRVL